jgi:hypothetical protein
MGLFARARVALFNSAPNGASRIRSLEPATNPAREIAGAGFASLPSKGGHDPDFAFAFRRGFQVNGGECVAK